MSEIHSWSTKEGQVQYDHDAERLYVYNQTGVSTYNIHMHRVGHVNGSKQHLFMTSVERKNYQLMQLVVDDSARTAVLHTYNDADLAEIYMGNLMMKFQPEEQVWW